MVQEEGLPDLYAAGDVRLSVGVQPEPRGEQHHVGVGAKHRPRRSRAGDAAAHGGIEALQARGIHQVVANRSVKAGHCVEQAGQPAVIPRDEPLEKGRPVFGRGSGQLGPSLGGVLPARHHRMTAADFEHAAEEVEHMGVRLQARISYSFAQALSGFAVELGEPQVQAADGRVADEATR